MKKSTLNLLCRLFLAAVFLLAAVPKLISPHDFAQIVFQYQMLPDVGINITAITLPAVEGVAALMLVIGPKRWQAAAVWLVTVLLILFTAVISLKLYQGADIECGCFSTAAAAGSQIGLENVIRNGGLLILAIFVLVSGQKNVLDSES